MLWWSLGKLKSKNPQTRIRAIQEIGRSEEKAAFQGLCEMLHDPQKEVRKAAITQLIWRERAFGGSKHVQVLIDCLGHLEHEIEIKEGIKKLHRKGSPYVRPMLVKALASESAAAQQSALDCLKEVNPTWWQTPSSEEIDALIVGMKEGSRMVKEGAIAALGHFDRERVIESLKEEQEKQPELNDHFEAALNKAEARLAQRKASVAAQEKKHAQLNCAACKEPLDFSRKIGAGILLGNDLLNSMGRTAYRCERCSTLLCMTCAQTKVCPDCRGNTFDLAIG